MTASSHLARRAARAARQREPLPLPPTLPDSFTTFEGFRITSPDDGHLPGGSGLFPVMDFADWHQQGAQPSRDFNQVLFPEDPAAIPWTIPSGGA